MTFVVRIDPSSEDYENNYIFVAEAEEYYLARNIGNYYEENTQVHALSKKKWRLHKV